MTLSFGLHFSCQSPDGEWESLYPETVEQARLAEAVGFDSLYVAEHHFLPDGWVPTPAVLLGGFAAATDLTIGTDIVIMPLHHPIEVAEQAAVLDLLSEGQFRLGVAIGWRDAEFEGFEIDKRERAPRTEEGIEIVRRLLTETDVSYDGDFHTLDDVTVTPRPTNDVPIWYGGKSEPAIRRAARMADAWIMSPTEDRSELAAFRQIYEEALADAGRSYDDVTIPLRREAYVAADEETAWEEVFESLRYEYTNVYPRQEGTPSLDEFREYATDRFIVGSPADAVRELEAYRDGLGVDEVLLRCHFPGLDPARSRKSIRLIGEEVIPQFR